jgi:hypothetical protein
MADRYSPVSVSGPTAGQRRDRPSLRPNQRERADWIARVGADGGHTCVLVSKSA